MATLKNKWFYYKLQKYPLAEIVFISRYQYFQIVIFLLFSFFFKAFLLNFFPFSDLSTDDLLIQVVPEHLELRHWLLDGAAISLLRHLLQQEARLVVQALHLDLQLVGLSFELLKHTYNGTPNQPTEVQSFMDNTSDPRRYGFSAQDLSYCTSKTMRLLCEARAFVPV